mmetsp:Transcript_27419/g.76894  ORF Transcript_27419/g.76894 Transcript_27419/m.76894 type:complete len:451 (+) Transcript_27419:714-2066(+)
MHLPGPPVERLLAREYLVRDHGPRVHIGADVVVLVQRNLRCHVAQRADLPGHLERNGGVQGRELPRKAKVEQLDLPARQEADVGGLEVAEDDALVVQVLQGARHLRDDAQLVEVDGLVLDADGDLLVVDGREAGCRRREASDAMPQLAEAAAVDGGHLQGRRDVAHEAHQPLLLHVPSRDALLQTLLQAVQQEEEGIVTSVLEGGDAVLRPSPDLEDVGVVEGGQHVRLAGQLRRGNAEVVRRVHEARLQVLAGVLATVASLDSGDVRERAGTQHPLDVADVLPMHELDGVGAAVQPRPRQHLRHLAVNLVGHVLGNVRWPLEPLLLRLLLWWLLLRLLIVDHDDGLDEFVGVNIAAVLRLRLSLPEKQRIHRLMLLRLLLLLCYDAVPMQRLVMLMLMLRLLWLHYLVVMLLMLKPLLLLVVHCYCLEVQRLVAGVHHGHVCFCAVVSL